MAIAVVCVTQGAAADVPAICASVAENFANTNVKDVKLWLVRYHETFASCIAGNGLPYQSISNIKIFDESDADKLSTQIIQQKPGNPKAVFRSPLLKQVVTPRQKPIGTLKPRPTLLKLMQKRKDLSRTKKTIKITVVPAVRPIHLSLPSSDNVQKVKAIRSVGAEGWRINCSPRFGGWDKVSDWYVSTTGKRVSCAIKP